MGRPSFSLARHLRAYALSIGSGLIVGGCAADYAPRMGAVVTIAAEGATNPTTAVDPGGKHAYVAWVGAPSEPHRADVWLARVGADGSIEGQPVRVNTIPGDAAPHEQAPAQVAVGPEGNVYVAYQHSIPIAGRKHPASVLRVARSIDGGLTFEPAIDVNDDADGPPSSHTFHHIMVGPEGKVYVSWLDGRLREAHRIERAAASGVNPHDHGATDEKGIPGSDVRIAWSTDGGRTFSRSVVVDGGVCPCCRTALALGPDGVLYVAWRKAFPDEVKDVVVARSEDGGRSWGPPVRVHGDNWQIQGCPHVGPSLAVDAYSRLHVTWFTGAPGRPGLYYAKSNDGATTFSEPSALVTGDWVPVTHAKLAADGEGVWLAWSDARGDKPMLKITHTDGSTIPSAAAATEPVPGASPAVSAQNGLTSFAWLDGEAVRARVVRTQRP